MEKEQGFLAGDEWTSCSIDATYDDVDDGDMLNMNYIEL